MSLAFRRFLDAANESATLPTSLHFNRRLSQWLRVHPDGVIEVRSGKVELGQGIITALAQIAAAELRVPIEHIRMVPASTAYSPDEAFTSGSLSVQESGEALRHVCAEARAIYAQAAAAELNVAPETLTTEGGCFIAPDGRRARYADLAKDELLDREADATFLVPRRAEPCATPVARLDLPDKIFGRPRYVHDLELPGLLHGRILRPSSPAASLQSLDESSARTLPGVVEVVRDGRFVGVIAEREDVALKAVKRLSEGAVWRDEESLPDCGALVTWLKAQPVETTIVEDKGVLFPAVIPARTVHATYSRPFLAHGSIGASCAVAQWKAQTLHVWTHSQGIYNLRTDLARTFSMPAEAVMVEHVEGAGCYGHNGADDVALDAALLAREARGRPVKVAWSREDELSWSPFGPAMAVDVEADLSDAGEICAWRHSVWSNGHSLRPGRAPTPSLLAATHLERSFLQLCSINAPEAAGWGAERNAVPAYPFPARRIVSRRVLQMPIRASALRSLGAFMNVFAIESFMDELASVYEEDPLTFRLRHLDDPRASRVLRAAAARARWSERRREEGRGHGLGFARYKNTGAWCAAIAEVEAQQDVRVTRLTLAVDVGFAIHPDGVLNQIEGGAIQATSWTLKEQVRFDRTRITSRTWEDYPLLRFSEVPQVDVEIISEPGERALGAGEAAQGPVAGAIANAVYDALGVRVRDLPITAERIIAAAGN